MLKFSIIWRQSLDCFESWNDKSCSVWYVVMLLLDISLDLDLIPSTLPGLCAAFRRWEELHEPSAH